MAKYIWDPPGDGHTLGKTRKGEPVDLDDKAAAAVRATWGKVDPLKPVNPPTPKPAAPAKGSK